MDFAFNETQREWHEAAIRFAREELNDPDIVQRDQRGEFCAKATGAVPVSVPPAFPSLGTTGVRDRTP